MIADNYGIIMVIYHPFAEYDISGTDSQNSILDLIQWDNVLIYNDHQETISDKYVSVFSNLHYYSRYFID